MGHRFTRREFIEKSAMGTAALGLGPGTFLQGEQPAMAIASWNEPQEEDGDDGGADLRPPGARAEGQELRREAALEGISEVAPLYLLPRLAEERALEGSRHERQTPEQKMDGFGGDKNGDRDLESGRQTDAAREYAGDRPLVALPGRASRERATGPGTRRPEVRQIPGLSGRSKIPALCGSPLLIS